MVASLAMEPVAAGSASTYRYRSSMGERPLLSEATKEPSPAAHSGERHDFPAQPQQQQPAPVNEPDRSRTADFAAAVIAGALSPTPHSMEELIRRIGSSEISEESQARLKDLLA